MVPFCRPSPTNLTDQTNVPRRNANANSISSPNNVQSNIDAQKCKSLWAYIIRCGAGIFLLHDSAQETFEKSQTSLYKNKSFPSIVDMRGAHYRWCNRQTCEKEQHDISYGERHKMQKKQTFEDHRCCWIGIKTHVITSHMSTKTPPNRLKSLWPRIRRNSLSRCRPRDKNKSIE